MPTAEAKGLPNPAPRGAWVPMTHTHTQIYALFFCIRKYSFDFDTMTAKIRLQSLQIVVCLNGSLAIDAHWFNTVNNCLTALSTQKKGVILQ